VLSIDEYEAIRLADHLGKDHLEASEMMHISRPTFSRLIERARQKTAHALIDGMELIIEGGNVDFCHARFRCGKCGSEQIQPCNQHNENCTECGSEDLTTMNNGVKNNK
jgi:hypothetical protein